MALQQLFEAVFHVSLGHSESDWRSRCREIVRLRHEGYVLDMAAQLVRDYRAMGEREKLSFFQFLLNEFRIDVDQLKSAIDAYTATPNPINVQALNRASEPARRKLFALLNMVPNGTRTILDMRADLHRHLAAHPELKAVDSDIDALLRAWFNRGLLELREIDWDCPASLLERIMALENNHPFSDWTEFQTRLQGNNRCFAFFHPALQNDPIMIAHIALTKDLPDELTTLLTPSSKVTDPDTIVFYSINECQPELQGVALGDLLLKQTVNHLAAGHPKLTRVATLSPLPGFRRWLKQKLWAGEFLTPFQAGQVQNLLADQTWTDDPERANAAKAILAPLAAHYLVHEKRGQSPMDPECQFHMRNGATLQRLNWLADTSDKGLNESLTFQVNYVYDHARVAANHMEYAANGAMHVDANVEKLAADVIRE